MGKVKTSLSWTDFWHLWFLEITRNATPSTKPQRTKKLKNHFKCQNHTSKKKKIKLSQSKFFDYQSINMSNISLLMSKTQIYRNHRNESLQMVPELCFSPIDSQTCMGLNRVGLGEKNITIGTNLYVSHRTNPNSQTLWRFLLKRDSLILDPFFFLLNQRSM